MNLNRQDEDAITVHLPKEKTIQNLYQSTSLRVHLDQRPIRKQLMNEEKQKSA